MSDEARNGITTVRDISFDMLKRALAAAPVKKEEGHLAAAAFVRQYSDLYVQACDALLESGDLSKSDAKLQRKFAKAYMAMMDSEELLPVVEQVEEHMAARVKLLVKQRKASEERVRQNKLRLDAARAARTL